VNQHQRLATAALQIWRETFSLLKNGIANSSRPFFVVYRGILSPSAISSRRASPLPAVMNSPIVS
jgi:hypothetical protein